MANGLKNMDEKFKDDELTPCAHCNSDNVKIVPDKAKIETGWPSYVMCCDCKSTSPNKEIWNSRP